MGRQAAPPVVEGKRLVTTTTGGKTAYAYFKDWPRWGRATRKTPEPDAPVVIPSDIRRSLASMRGIE